VGILMPFEQGGRRAPYRLRLADLAGAGLICTSMWPYLALQMFKRRDRLFDQIVSRTETVTMDLNN
jgi:hypothetical protein